MKLNEIRCRYFNGIADCEKQDATSIIVVIDYGHVIDFEIPMRADMKQVVKKLRILSNEIERDIEDERD